MNIFEQTNNAMEYLISTSYDVPAETIDTFT